MKKFRLAAGVVSGLLFAASSAFANDVLVKFEGKVVESTCLVTGEDVKLEPVSVSSLKATGDVSAPRPFAITVTGCDGSKLKGRFAVNPSNIDMNTGAIVNTVSGGSSAQIQLLDYDSKPVDLSLHFGGNALAPKYADATQTIFPFFAQYLAANGPVTAGDVKAELMFDLVYE